VLQASVEGGTTLARAFVRAGLANRLVRHASAPEGVA